MPRKKGTAKPGAARARVAIDHEPVSTCFVEDEDIEDVERQHVSEFRESMSLGNGSYRSIPRHYD